MPCNAGRRTSAHGYPPCRGSTACCRGAGRRCIGMQSSMARSARRRDWAKATDVTDIFPAVDDEDPAESSPTDDYDQPAESDRVVDARLRLKRFGRAIVDRLPQLSVAIVAGLALCVSFPPFGWWYLAIAAFVMLAWVLTRESTTLAGGFGYGFLFGLAFYLPLL